MITKKSNKNTALFQKASLALSEEGNKVEISNLNEYFSYIVDLAAKDIQYTVLPLDEDPFIINANTRTIEIPNEFRAGVGVQGDQVAEIIYFEIDRYFDAIDLDTQNIYIEWKNLSSGDQGFSQEYNRDLSSTADKIIFGWPLTNDITKQSGKIQFSVRFYTIEDDKIIYSFSTKPQTITVNDSMDFDLMDATIPVLGEDVKEMILQRFENSKIVGSNDIAEPPIFFEDGNLEDGALIDLNSISGEANLKVQAYGDGFITYYLQEQKNDNSWVLLSEAPKVYLPTNDITRQENNIYYIKTTSSEGGVSGWMVYEGDLPEDNSGDNPVCEAYGMATVNSIGKYRIVAQNRVGKATNTKASNFIEVPGAIIPRVDVGPFSVLLNKDSNTAELLVYPANNNEPTIDGGKQTYQWGVNNNDIELANESSYIATEEGDYYLIVTNIRNKDQKSTNKIMYRVTNPPEQPEIVFPTNNTTIVLGNDLKLEILATIPHDKISVNWYKKNLSDESEELIATDTFEGQDQYVASFTPNISGAYYASVVTVRNGHEADPLNSIMWSVIA